MPDRNNKLIESLAEKKLLGTVSAEEQLLLDEWLNRQPDHALLLDKEEEAALKDRLLKAIKEQAGIDDSYIPQRRIAPQRRRWAAAASIIILIAAGSYFFWREKLNKEEKMAQAPHDITAPAANLATITLANGQMIYLDSNPNGELAIQGKVKLVKEASGKITYKTAVTGQEQQLLYNTLKNPKGSKVTWLTLADGTKVWLNAGSSLTYPVAFVNNERKVAITGEAYFEVSPDKAKPFIVTKDNTQVKVLGTHFNINAYNDEAEMKVTLLEGAVQVAVFKPGTTMERESLTLVPGQQARLANHTQAAGITVTKNIDIPEVMAWKNGEFRFKNTPVTDLLRQAARWYNVEFSYSTDIAAITLSGVITRQENISKLLQIIAATNQVQFDVQGKIIKVTPYKKIK